jgi:hypothetical protein
MVSAYVVAYIVVWTVTAVATYLTGRRLSCAADGPDSPVLTSIFAGALWPIVLVGLVEAAMVGCLQAFRRTETTIPWELADIITLP